MEAHYPEESCPFCQIASTYPHPPKSSENDLISTAPSASFIPDDAQADPTKLEPQAFIIYSSPTVLAFLDIMPLSTGHLLVTTRSHAVKASDMTPDQGSSIGTLLPVLSRVVCRVTGATDYNIVQNNGPTAAQVVPHVHFHILPRNAPREKDRLPDLRARSWTMFGRGQRSDLDEEEGEKVAREMRRVLKEELDQLSNSKAKL